jgi:hypothetical protein
MSLVGPDLPEQLRQSRDVDGDPSRLVVREHLSLPCLGFVVAGIDVGERLTVGVPDDIAAGHRVGCQGGGKRRDPSGMGKRL